MHGSVLITGGSGFIGSHLVRQLLAQGVEVHVTTRPGSSLWRLADVAKRFRPVELHLTDIAALRATIDECRPNAVFHLAGATNSRRPMADFSDVRAGIDANLVSTIGLVEAAALAKAPPETIIRAGSLEEYGQGPAPYREGQRENAVSSYSASYIATSHFWEALQPRVPFSLTTLRVALAYGPAQAETFLVPALIRACLSDQDFTLTSSGNQTRDYIYVDDVVDGFLRAAEQSSRLRGNIVNISTGKGERIREVAELIKQLSGAKITLQFGSPSDRPVDIAEQRGDPALASNLLGWKANTSLRDGLLKTIAWYANNRTLP